MNVFVLGGTGTIGRAIVTELVGRSHRVFALSRSERSDEKLENLGALPRRGDLAAPEGWAAFAASCGAIIQVAATFADDMGDVDAEAIYAIRDAAADQPAPVRLIYTGGCWLYGETGDEVATEERAFDPLPAFAWMVSHAEELLAAPSLSTAVVHPAMVYDGVDGGVFNRFISSARAGQPIEIWGSPQTRWPLIDSADLARAYCDLVQRADLVGHFNAVAEQGVAVGEIVQTISEVCGSTRDPISVRVDEVIAEHGAWARGPALDQQMSGRKLQAATGWQPHVTDYRQAGVIKRAVT